MSTIYDISPMISPSLKVFPGDTSPGREVLLDINRGDHITLSTLRTTVHVGSHVDAPNHYGKGGRSMDQQPLDLYIGCCQVMHVNVARGELVATKHLTSPITQPRLLLATATFPDPDNWTEDFAGIEPGLIDHLASEGVQLIGIDTPSVDPSTSKTLDAHQRVFDNDMAILEGIVLADVADGEYELIALPLKLQGFDGSPVRAVLRALDEL